MKMKYRCIAPWKIYQVGQILEEWEFRRIPVDKQGRFELIRVSVTPAVDEQVEPLDILAIVNDVISSKVDSNAELGEYVKVPEKIGKLKKPT